MVVWRVRASLVDVVPVRFVQRLTRSRWLVPDTVNASCAGVA